MESAERYCPQDMIWEKLAGKKLVLIGNENCQKQEFMQNLACIREQRGLAFTVSDRFEDIGAGDCVFVFGGIEDEGGFRILEEVLMQLAALTRLHPASVVLVSDNRVYGKCFGASHALKEDELGYVCHTAGEDVPLQCMRYIEHFAVRLAREEGLPVKIARAGGGQAGEAFRQMLEAAICVMLSGTDGEVYNLPAQAGHFNGQEQTEKASVCGGAADRSEEPSPLSPMAVVTDAGRAVKLMQY